MSLRQPDHSMDLELDSAATSVPGTLASSQLCVSDAESWSLAPVLCRRGRESCCQTCDTAQLSSQGIFWGPLCHPPFDEALRLCFHPELQAS